MELEDKEANDKVWEYLKQWYESSEFDIDNIEQAPDEFVYNYYDLTFEVTENDEDKLVINLFKTDYEGYIELEPNIMSKFVWSTDLRKYVIHTEDYTLELNEDEYNSVTKFVKAYFSEEKTLEESFEEMVR